MVADLVHADHEEVVDHDLGDGLHPGHGGADGGADDRLLCDRCGAHPVRTEAGGEPVGGLDHSTGRIGDVLTDQEHGRIGFERNGQRLVHGLAEGQHASRGGLVLACGTGCRALDREVGDVRWISEDIQVELRRIGGRAGARVVDRSVDLGTDGGFHCLELAFGRHALVQETLPEHDERRMQPGSRKSGLIHVPLLAPEGMPLQAMTDRLDQRGAAPFTGALHGFPGGFIHGDRVSAVDANARHLVGIGTLREIFRQRVVGQRGVFGVLVVLADENHRELPDGGEVERLMERTDARGAIAEVAHAQAVGFAQLLCERESVGNGQPRADDARRDHQSGVRI